MSEEPKLTKRMTMHLNGGNKFSELHYEVLADGKLTGITQHRRTNGSPKYLITDDIWRCGDDEFDARAVNNVGLLDWIKAHLPKPPESAQGIPHGANGVQDDSNDAH